MASMGLAGFAEGLGEGYNRGIQQNREEAKAQREAEAFELDKKIKLAQIDEVERKKAMQDQIKRDMQALTMNAAGGTVGGTGTDEFGTEIPGLKYNNPAEAKASGLSFKAGTTVDAPAMNEFAKNRATFEIFKKARIDNGFMDEESWTRSMEMTKKLKKEGIDDAFQTYLTTGDSDAALKIFNESGGMKAPKGSFLKREVDPQTGMVDVGIYIPGKDGVPQQYTTMNQYLLMTNTDALMKHYAEMNKSKFEQGQANKRTGMEVAGRVDAAIITANGKDGAGGKKDRVKERIDNMVFGVGKAVAGNPSNVLKSDDYVAKLEQVAALAYDLMRQGQFDDEGAAVVAARKKLGVAQ